MPVRLPASPRHRALFTLGAALVYVGAYLSLHARLGHVVGTFVAVPMMVCAWMYGTRAGLLSVAVALIANTVLANLTGTPGVLAVVERGGLPGFVVLLLIALLIGLLRDAGLEIKRKGEALAASLLALERAQDKLVRAEKLAVFVSLTSALQHEINNPISAAQINIGFLEQQLKKLARFVEASVVVVEAGRTSKDEVLASLADEAKLLLGAHQPQNVERELTSAATESLDAMKRVASSISSLTRLQEPSTPREVINLDRFLAQTLAALSPSATVASTGTSATFSQMEVGQAIGNVYGFVKRAGAPVLETVRVGGRPALSISGGQVLNAQERMSLLDPQIRPDASGKTMRADFELAIAFQLAANGGVDLQVHDSAHGGTAFQFVFDGTAPLPG